MKQFGVGIVPWLYPEHQQSFNRVKNLHVSSAMNGGKVVSHRALCPRFGETVGKVSGVDWLFGLDDVDPWVRTCVVVIVHRSFNCSLLSHSWRANSNVVRDQLLAVVGKRMNNCPCSLTPDRCSTRLMSFKSSHKGSTRH